MKSHVHIIKMGGTIEFIDPAYDAMNKKLMQLDTTIEITLVGIYAETSPAWVSMIGRAVKDPPPFTKCLIDSGKSFMSLAIESEALILAARSSKRE